MRVNFARFVFSQSCSWLRSVVARRLSIIVLMLSLSSATSPRASTWIDRVRSPFVTAVAPFDADLARHVRDLLGERRQGIRHVVDRVGERSDLALRFDRQLLTQV